jgi:hypothetical protein
MCRSVSVFVGDVIFGGVTMGVSGVRKSVTVQCHRRFESVLKLVRVWVCELKRRLAPVRLM